MLIIDDVILFPLAIMGIEPVPNLFRMIFDAIHKNTLKEMYPLEKTESEIKENRLEFELGEISREEYEKINKELMDKLKIAKQVRELNFDKRMDILGS